MQKAASLTLRVSPDTRSRLDNIARITRRSRSYVIEEALDQYLDLNEWQVKGVLDAIVEADAPDADFTDHDDVVAAWKARHAA